MFTDLIQTSTAPVIKEKTHPTAVAPPEELLTTAELKLLWKNVAPERIWLPFWSVGFLI